MFFLCPHSVLDLDAFERCCKAEGLGMAVDANSDLKNLADSEFTMKLFRFLQLMCEGHNAGTFFSLSVVRTCFLHVCAHFRFSKLSP